MLKSQLEIHNQKETPTVSVIITTYKRSDMLERAIESVLKQNYQNIEVIIVDDNDPNTEFRNKTEELMKNYTNNSKIKYLKHEKNKNGAAARNTGINNSIGKYITFLDDDDTYFDNKVSEQVKFLEENKSFQAVYCGWIDGNRVITPKYEGDITFYVLSGEVRLITNSIMITRLSAISSGGWDESFRRNQEAAFLLRFLKEGFQIGILKKHLFKVDTDDRSNSSNPKQTEEDFDYFLAKHKEQISSSSVKIGRSKKIIYSYRYRGVLLNYIKHEKYRDGIILYLKIIKYLPIRFNVDLLKYIYDKIRGKDFYS